MASPVFQSGTFNKEAELLRRTGYRDMTGRWRPSTNRNNPPRITVIPQPAPADDQRENIPGGARLTGAMNFYMEPSATVDAIRVRPAADDPSQSGGDIIRYPVGEEHGVEYEALIRLDWPDYVRITAVRVEGQ